MAIGACKPLRVLGLAFSEQAHAAFRGAGSAPWWEDASGREFARSEISLANLCEFLDWLFRQKRTQLPAGRGVRLCEVARVEWGCFVLGFACGDLRVLRLAFSAQAHAAPRGAGSAPWWEDASGREFARSEISLATFCEFLDWLCRSKRTQLSVERGVRLYWVARVKWGFFVLIFCLRRDLRVLGLALSVCGMASFRTCFGILALHCVDAKQVRNVFFASRFAVRRFSG